MNRVKQSESVRFFHPTRAVSGRGQDGLPDQNSISQSSVRGIAHISLGSV